MDITASMTSQPRGSSNPSTLHNFYTEIHKQLQTYSFQPAHFAHQTAQRLSKHHLSYIGPHSNERLQQLTVPSTRRIVKGGKVRSERWRNRECKVKLGRVEGAGCGEKGEEWDVNGLA